MKREKCVEDEQIVEGKSETERARENYCNTVERRK